MFRINMKFPNRRSGARVRISRALTKQSKECKKTAGRDQRIAKEIQTYFMLLAKNEKENK